MILFQNVNDMDFPSRKMHLKIKMIDEILSLMDIYKKIYLDIFFSFCKYPSRDV